MQSISERKSFPLLDDFTLSENPLAIASRLIHAFSNLPIQVEKSPVNEEKIKVLCVDDDESILRGYQLNLERISIYILLKVAVESISLKSRRVFSGFIRHEDARNEWLGNVE